MRESLVYVFCGATKIDAKRGVTSATAGAVNAHRKGELCAGATAFAVH